MRSRFLLVPAALVASAPAMAADYLTVEQAQAVLFPGASFTPADIILTEAQIDTVVRDAQAPLLRAKLRAWRVSGGGWFLLDQVFGRDDRIVYAVGLDKDGAVVGVEILVCLPEYSAIRTAAWRRQFTGKSMATVGEIGGAGTVITGTTLSSVHIAEGVRRLLVTHALILAPQGAK